MSPSERQQADDAPRFLIDQNVPEAVCRFLIEQGYTVLRSRELTAVDAPDNVLAFIATTEGLVLVSHDKDFKNLIQQFPEGYRTRAKKGAGQIIFQVRENQAATRLRALWESVLFHYYLAQRESKRFYVRIMSHQLTVIDNAQGHQTTTSTPKPRDTKKSKPVRR